MSLYVAAYDIGEDGRRRQVARYLLQYGHRVQESVFEIWLEPDEVAEFRRELGLRLDTQDSFDLFPIELRHSRHRIRWQRPPFEWKPVLLL